MQSALALTPDLEALLARIAFSEPGSARARLKDLAGDPHEMIALARLSPVLEGALSACADADRALNNLDRVVQARGARLQLYHRFADEPATLDRLLQLLGGSQFLADILVRNPEYLTLLADDSWLGEERDRPASARELAGICAAFPSRETRLNAVRRFCRREILRIGAADLLGLTDFRRTVGELSRLADVIVGQCLAIVSEGEPSDGGLIVLALGKLGGAELNYSSDIDLVFVDQGPPGREETVKLARALTEALRGFSEEGFLYRVDLRLRPWGGAGALVVSAENFEDYLAAKAFPAERQAMLKARAVAGDLEGGARLLERVASVIFRDRAESRAEVRELKLRIERQLLSQGHAAGHVKLAPGGIRDVEFVLQALQLEHGGSDPEVRTGNTLDGLEKMARAGVLSSADEASLSESYVFLRSIEHRLQLMENQQVHELPRNRRDLRALARSLGFQEGDEVSALRNAYGLHAKRVREIFDRLLR